MFKRKLLTANAIVAAGNLVRIECCRRSGIVRYFFAHSMELRTKRR